MISFDLDKARNRIFINMSENISVDEAGMNIKKFVDLCKELEDGFSIINDISKLDMVSDAELVTLTKVHIKMCELFKVGSVIRIVGESKSLLMQLSQIDKKFDLKNIYYVPTMKEAVALDEKS